MAGSYSLIEEAHSVLENRLEDQQPGLALILGSGLGVMAEEITSTIQIPYSDIPGFPVSTVEGHKGELVIGELEGKQVVLFNGRSHFYEGFKMTELALPVRVLKQLGIEKLVVTNAAGGVNEEFSAGDLMLITDHLNFSFTNPLIGPNLDQMGPRFPDTSNCYAPELIELALDIAAELKLNIKKGVYMFNPGPTYETPAEVRMARYLGADAVGMSTVPEVLVANHCGIKVLGISCISNLAAGILDQPLDHKEVMETVEKIKATFIRFMRVIIKKI